MKTTTTSITSITAITSDALVTVTGGAKPNEQVTQQLTALQGSIKDLASSKNTTGSTDSTTMMMMMMALRPQPQPTVVAASPAASPVVNINTRVRR